MGLLNQVLSANVHGISVVRGKTKKPKKSTTGDIPKLAEKHYNLSSIKTSLGDI